MGCKHYFVANRLEDLVDEDGLSIFFTSSRTREFSACVTTVCGQSRHPDVYVSLLELVGPMSTNGSPRSISICIYVLCLCLYLSLHVHNKQFGILAVKRETCFDFLSTRTGRLFWHNKPPCSMNWIRVCLRWLGAFCLSRNFWTHSFEHVWCRLHKPCSDVSSTLSACTVQDAVLSGRLSQDLCVLYPYDSKAERIPSVFCSKFWTPGINPETMMECKLIAHPTWQVYLKKTSGIKTLSCDRARR